MFISRRMGGHIIILASVLQIAGLLLNLEHSTFTVTNATGKSLSDQSVGVSVCYGCSVVVMYETLVLWVSLLLLV